MPGDGHEEPGKNEKQAVPKPHPQPVKQHIVDIHRTVRTAQDQVKRKLDAFNQQPKPKRQPCKILASGTGDEIDPKTKWHSHQDVFIDPNGAGPRKIPTVIKIQGDQVQPTVLEHGNDLRPDCSRPEAAIHS